MIILLYHLLHDEKDTGTNLVLSAIHSGDEIPLRMAPLIFISTLITHLFGGSAGTGKVQHFSLAEASEILSEDFSVLMKKINIL